MVLSTRTPWDVQVSDNFLWVVKWAPSFISVLLIWAHDTSRGFNSEFQHHRLTPWKPTTNLRAQVESFLFTNNHWLHLSVALERSLTAHSMMFSTPAWVKQTIALGLVLGWLMQSLVWSKDSALGIDTCSLAFLHSCKTLQHLVVLPGVTALSLSCSSPVCVSVWLELSRRSTWGLHHTIGWGFGRMAGH